MRRLQIMIDEELDQELRLEASREGVSIAELIRRYVRERLGRKKLPPLEQDPLWAFVGLAGDAEPVDDIDEFLYGPIERE